jgi:hypothetical protein
MRVSGFVGDDSAATGQDPPTPCSDGLTDDGEVTDESTASFLREFMQEFRDHTERVLTVLPWN